MQSRNLAHYFPTTPASQLERVAALRQHRECYALLPKLPPGPIREDGIRAYGDMRKILLISGVCLAIIPIFFWVSCAGSYLADTCADGGECEGRRGKRACEGRKQNTTARRDSILRRMLLLAVTLALASPSSPEIFTCQKLQDTITSMALPCSRFVSSQVQEQCSVTYLRCPAQLFNSDRVAPQFQSAPPRTASVADPTMRPIQTLATCYNLKQTWTNDRSSPNASLN